MRFIYKSKPHKKKATHLRRFKVEPILNKFKNYKFCDLARLLIFEIHTDTKITYPPQILWLCQ